MTKANNQYQGHCQCGEVSFELRLPEALEQYRPRACDCDFCTERAVQYLSDPKGALNIKFKSPLKRFKQGSNQADFLACSSCEQIIAASLALTDKTIGAVNATLLTELDKLKSSESVSPKKLSACQKLERWQQLWLTLKFNPNN